MFKTIRLITVDNELTDCLVFVLKTIWIKDKLRKTTHFKKSSIQLEFFNYL